MADSDIRRRIRVAARSNLAIKALLLLDATKSVLAVASAAT